MEDPEAAWMPLMEHRWEPPLCAAIKFKCSHEIIKLLLEHRGDADQCDVMGQPAFTLLFKQAQQRQQQQQQKQKQQKQIHTTEAGPPSGFNMCQQLQPSSLTWLLSDDVPQFGESFAGNEEQRLLGTAGQLLKSGYACNVFHIAANTCEDKLADDPIDSKFTQLLQDWPDLMTCGLLLKTLEQHQHNQKNEANIRILYNLTECWEKMIGYIICLDTWPKTGLRFTVA